MFRILGEEAVLLNLASGTYFGLDEVGTRMWQLISEHGSTDKVVATMLDEYEVAENQLRDDLNNLIQQLNEKGLVTPDAQEAPPSE
jgi:hypothetical protein